jgi:uncharacterized membrane protein
MQNRGRTRMDKFERVYVTFSRDEIRTIKKANRLHMGAYFLSRTMYILAIVPAIVLVMINPIGPFSEMLLAFTITAILLYIVKKAMVKGRDAVLLKRRLAMMWYDSGNDMIIVTRV